MGSRRPRRVQLRTRVLVGVLAVIVMALGAFDFAAVAALRGYLLRQTDARLQTVLSLYRPVDAVVPAAEPVTVWPQAGSPGQRQMVVTGPRVQVPASLGEYYVVFVAPGGPRVFVKGNPSLVPQPAWVSVGAPTRPVQTVLSSDGAGQLRLRVVNEAGGSLIATTSLAGVNQTIDRLELIILVGSAVALLLVAIGVAGSSAAACGRLRRWSPRRTGFRPGTSPNGSARTIPGRRWGGWG